MRSARTIFGLVVAVCAFAALAATASAEEFHASVVGGTISEEHPAEAKSKEGGSGEITFGPYKIECEKEPSSKGVVTAEVSPTFTTTMTLKGCHTLQKLPGGNEVAENEKGEKIHLIEKAKVKLVIPIAFHSNGSGEFEEGAELGGTSFVVKAAGRTCVVDVPHQQVPAKVGKEGSEFVEFTNEEGEISESKKSLEEFPKGFQPVLEIEMELKKIVAFVHLSTKCVGETSSGKELTSGEVEFKGGRLEADLEEIKIKHGSLSFE